MKKKVLSLTIDETLSLSDTEFISIMNQDLLALNNYPDEYSISIAGSIVKRILTIKNMNQYSKFYQIVTSSSFRNNRYIYMSLEKNDLGNLKDLFILYDTEKEYIDYIFLTREKLFDELIMSNKFRVSDFLSADVIDKFSVESYRNLLLNVFKSDDKGKVVKALLRSRNDKFIEMVSLMDNYVLENYSSDNEFFDVVLSLLNYNNYRRLLWDYYKEYIYKKKRDTDKQKLKMLIDYSFNLMINRYYTDNVPPILNSLDNLEKDYNADKDLVNTMMFGVEGYKKIGNNTFNRLKDFPLMNDDNQLLLFKVSFFSIIYGVTYKQAEKILNDYKDFNKKFNIKIKKERIIHETLVSMKTLYGLKLEDTESINLYRNIFYRYIKKNGKHASVDVSASSIMLYLIKKSYEESIEVI
ncbi:MAG: hypothetical protein IKQ35_05735 [Bacilli bacterium]|nr:hypothetical protein [Bacilli bacterium]